MRDAARRNALHNTENETDHYDCKNYVVCYANVQGCVKLGFLYEEVGIDGSILGELLG